MSQDQDTKLDIGAVESGNIKYFSYLIKYKQQNGSRQIIFW
jgi:hypothetical protein